jgi:hypothetical protein
VCPPARNVCLGIGAFAALSFGIGLADAAAAPHRSLLNVAPAAVELVQVTHQAQPPVRIPEADVIVEVVAEGEMRAQVTNVTRRLGRRHVASGGNNDYLPTILELIMLVEPTPQKPRGPWTGVTVLDIAFDESAKQMSVEYCIDKCRLSKRTHKPDPQRKMILYTATEAHVMERLTKRLDELQPFAERVAAHRD